MALLIAPGSKAAITLLPVAFFAFGLWAVIFPSGAIAWAKAARKELDPSDESLWWVSRLVGAGFVFFSLVIAIRTISR